MQSVESNLVKGARDGLEPYVRERGLREVGRLSAVNHAQISGWLAGKCGMNLERVDRIAAAVGVRLVVTVEHSDEA